MIRLIPLLFLCIFSPKGCVLHKFFQKEHCRHVNICVKTHEIQIQMIHSKKQVTIPTSGSVSWIQEQSPDPLQPLKALKKAEGSPIVIYSDRGELEKGTISTIDFQEEKIIIFLIPSE